MNIPRLTRGVISLRPTPRFDNVGTHHRRDVDLLIKSEKPHEEHDASRLSKALALCGYDVSKNNTAKKGEAHMQMQSHHKRDVVMLMLQV